MDVLEHLVSEHRRAESLVAVLRDSEPGEERRINLAELEDALDMHMALEERYVYPLIEQHIGAEEETGAENEHDLTRNALRQMRQLAEEPGFSAAVDVLKGGLTHHVAEEEDEIFPQLREKAAAQIEALGSPEEMAATVKAQLMSRTELYGNAQLADVPGRSTMSREELEEAVAAEELETAEEIGDEVAREQDS